MKKKKLSEEKEKDLRVKIGLLLSMHDLAMTGFFRDAKRSEAEYREKTAEEILKAIRDEI